MISIIIPTYLSEKNLPVLIKRIVNVFYRIDEGYEIIFINDCSPDNTYPYLIDQNKLNKNVKIISLSRNFGQQSAISAGLDNAIGDAVIIMDDDLQDPPEFIPNLINKWRAGYDIVYTIRTKRKENLLKRSCYYIFYRILHYVSENKIPMDSGDFCILDNKVVKVISKMPEHTRFIRGLRNWVGFNQIGIECERDERYNGNPAYNTVKIINLGLDGIISFSKFPLRIATFLGFIVSMVSFIGFLFTFFQKIFTIIYPNNPIAVWPGFSTIVLLILFIGGVQLIVIGILSEYIGNIYNEVKDRPKYIVKDKVGF